MLNPTSPSSSASAPPFMLFSLLPLPCVPVAWRRSAALDLLLSGAALFLAFLMHDALQETFYHSLGVRAPVFITSLDFVGCASMGYAVILVVERSNAAANTATTATAAAAQRGAALARRSSSSVQIELVQVSDEQRQQTQQTDADGAVARLGDPSPRIRLSRHHASAESSPTVPASAVYPSHSAPASPAAAAAAPTPFLTYFALGFLILLSNFLGIASLSFVDYPLKVILRSSKLIPTMVLGRVVMGKRYAALHYTAAITLCAGVILFSLADMHHAQDEQAVAVAVAEGGVTRRLFSQVAAAAAVSTGSSDLAAPLSFPFNWLRTPESLMAFGIVLLVLSVIVDAINPNVAEFFLARKGAPMANNANKTQIQEGREAVPLLGASSASAVAPASSATAAAPPRDSSHGHGHASSDPLAVNRFMVGTNAAMLPLLLVALVYSGELPLVWERIRGQPSLLLLFGLYSTCSYLGVNAYTSLIKKHGSVLTVGLATMRKICTIALSYVFISSSSSASAAASSSSLPSAPGLSHPLDPVSLLPPPEKHFGSHHLLPSLLIVVGLALSAWIERGKQHGPATANAGGNATTSATTAPAPLSTAVAATSNGHAHASPLSGAPSSGSSSPSPPPSSAAATRLLAAELGLETDREGETSAAEESHSGGGDGGGGSRGQRLSKHSSQLSSQLHRDMFDGESDSDFI